MYRLDLSASLSRIPNSLLLDKIKPLVGDGKIYKLISSFLFLPIIDDDGNDRSDISFGCLPPVGKITSVLFDIYIMEIFDREFTKRFPSIAFYRFMHEVYIATRINSEVRFSEKAGYELSSWVELVKRKG